MSDFMESSSLMRLFKEEREEILRHKWVLSERAGRDVGYNTALYSWLRNHRQKWLESQIKRLTTSHSDNVPPAI